MPEPTSKNILLLIPNLDFGGAQRSFFALADELNKHHNVYICVFNKNYLHSYESKHNIISLDVPAGDSTLYKFLMFNRRIKKIRKLKCKLNINTCISYLEGANYLNVLSKGKEKVVISIRGSQKFDPTITGLTGYFRKKVLIPILYRRADHLVALNWGIKEELTKAFINPEKISVIYNYYEIKALEELSKESVVELDSSIFINPCIAIAGRLAPEKGLIQTLEILELVKQGNPNVKLILIGDGPLKSELHSKAASLNLKVAILQESELKDIKFADVIITGFQKNPYKFIKNSMLLLITSASEGGPNVLAEAMICETPVLSADCPNGPREHIAPLSQKVNFLSKAEFFENGILLPQVYNPAFKETKYVWADTICELIEDEALRQKIAKAAKNHIYQYNADKLYGAWKKII